MGMTAIPREAGRRRIAMYGTWSGPYSLRELVTVLANLQILVDVTLCLDSLSNVLEVEVASITREPGYEGDHKLC